MLRGYGIRREMRGATSEDLVNALLLRHTLTDLVDILQLEMQRLMPKLLRRGDMRYERS